MSAAIHRAKHKRKSAATRRRSVPLADFGPPVDREPLATCPVDRRHPPMIRQPSGAWLCRACGAQRLPELHFTIMRP
jgi:hypothetical protein